MCILSAMGNWVKLETLKYGKFVLKVYIELPGNYQ